jgi:hypothetical protein
MPASAAHAEGKSAMVTVAEPPAPTLRAAGVDGSAVPGRPAQAAAEPDVLPLAEKVGERTPLSTETHRER